MKYMIIEVKPRRGSEYGNNINDLGRRVEEWLADGWIPLGPPIIFTNKQDPPFGSAYQAIIKDDS